MTSEIRLVVDGEVFVAHERADEEGVWDLDWVSGPNPDYGFSSGGLAPTGHPREQLVDAIRVFLEQVDPETGYIED